MIERCIFVVCLDTKVRSVAANKENVISPLCTSPEESKVSNHVNGGNQEGDGGSEDDESAWSIEAAHQMLHGCNSDNNSGNRWFDKTMQFIISEDGKCGVNYEHSPAEGIVVIELSEHLFRYM